MSALVESFRRKKAERAIEDVLFAYPYLVDPALSRPKRQEVLSRRSRSDLAFYDGKKATVVEIKQDEAGVAAVRQLERYLKEQARRGFQAEGILVAASFTPGALKKAAKAKLACKKLHDDVAVEIVICKACRKARDRRVAACPDDRSRETLGRLLIG
ncbi:MAG TPA: endonuclease NucS domain-containing protein [Candidatus Methylacidiphilales bacterium]